MKKFVIFLVCLALFSCSGKKSYVLVKKDLAYVLAEWSFVAHGEPYVLDQKSENLYYCDFKGLMTLLALHSRLKIELTILDNKNIELVNALTAEVAGDFPFDDFLSQVDHHSFFLTVGKFVPLLERNFSPGSFSLKSKIFRLREEVEIYRSEKDQYKKYEYRTYRLYYINAKGKPTVITFSDDKQHDLFMIRQDILIEESVDPGNPFRGIGN